MRFVPATFAVFLAAACSPSGGPDPSKATTQEAVKPAPAPSAVASVAAAPPIASAASMEASAAAPDPGPPICTRSKLKVWGSGANKLTGLTTKKFGDKIAIGFALGNEPRVLVVDAKGDAKVLKVEVGDKAKVPDPKQGTRALFRVSPVNIDEKEARAFIDYRDEFKDKRRRVACGPAEADDNFLAYEGTSYMDMNPKPTGEDKKKIFSWKKLGGYVELRDCRTFTTQKGKETWAIGSVLRGIEKPDGTNEWKMVLLVDFGKNDDEIVLHEEALKGDPPKVVTFENPTSRRVEDKGFLLATRFGGSLLVGVLDSERKLQGKLKRYSGFPTMPDLARADQKMVLTVGVGAGKERTLKSLLIPRDSLELPAAYSSIPLVPMDTAAGEEEPSFTAPEFSMDSRGQRWLAYVEGPREKAHLRIVPLTSNMKPAGRAFSVTEGDVFASEGRLVELDGRGFVIAYLRDTAGKVEMVTESLSCEVKKEE